MAHFEADGYPDLRSTRLYGQFLLVKIADLTTVISKYWEQYTEG